MIAARLPEAQSPLDSVPSADNTPAHMTVFKGCTALITGASSGIGAEFARQLAPHAQCLVLVARRGERLDQLRDRCARPGLRIYCVAGDLGDLEGRQDVIGKIRATSYHDPVRIREACRVSGACPVPRQLEVLCEPTWSAMLQCFPGAAAVRR